MHPTGTHSVEDGDAFVEAETHDRRQIDLPQVQQQLVTAVVALGKPTVLVLFNGGSVALPAAVLGASNVAIIEAGYPGTRGSEAIASALFGAAAPPATTAGAATTTTTAAARYVDRFGRLPYSILPQSWTNDNRMDQMDLAITPGRTYKYLLNTSAAQFHFGAGLQLARLSLDLAPSRPLRTVSAATLAASPANHTYSLTLTNLPTSRYPCEAVITMYASPKSLPTQPAHHPLLGHRQLVGFQRVGTATSHGLAPGESTTVVFTVSAADLSVVDFGGSGDRVLAPGEYELSWETGSDEAAVRGLPLSITGAEVLIERYPVPAE
jgi:beta-glucosidase